MPSPGRGLLRTYNSALYAARGTLNAIRAYRRHAKRVRETSHPHTHPGDIVNRVQQATRGKLMEHRTAYSKGVLAGQARRLALANKLRAKPRPVRTYSAPTPQNLAQKYSTHDKGDSSLNVVNRSKTIGELRRRLRVHAVQEFTRTAHAASGKNARKRQADSLRHQRKRGFGPTAHANIKNIHAESLKSVARYLAKKK